MLRNVCARWTITCLVSVLCSGAGIVAASSPAEDVRTAAAAMQQRLGQSANAQAWIKFLQHDALLAELEEGAAADPQVITAVLAKYQSDTAGLEWAPFVAMRKALTSWSEELARQQGAALPQLIQNARQSFRPIDPSEATRAKRDLLASARVLQRMLDSGSRENAAAWKGYLRWDAMMAELQKPDAPDLRELQAAAAKYYRNEVGLELPQFTAVRDGLLRYLNAVSFSGDEQIADKYQAHLEELATLLEADAAQPSGDTATEIGTQLGWLERAGQAAPVLEAARARYWQPNLHAQISQKLAAAGFQEGVTETTGVRDNILGTSIRGTATMRGTTDVILQDDARRASLELLLTGTVVSSNVGVKRRVSIQNQGLTRVSALKRIFISSTGLTSSSAVARCSTDTRITGVSAGSCLVESLARRQIDRKQGQAEQIASRHAEDRVEQRFDERVNDLLLKAEDAFQEKFRKPLLRRDQFPQEMRFSTQGGYLSVVWRQATGSQVAASTPPPSLETQHDLAVRVHETFVSNFSRARLGGVTLTDERLEKILEDATGSVPEELKVTQDKEPWSITFDSINPVSAKFSDGMIRFAIRGRRFTLGDQRINDTLQMSADYTLEKTPAGAHLTRQGDVSVDFIDAKGTLSPQQIGLRAVMRRKFEALFEPEFQTDGLTLPGRWKAAGKLHLQQMLSGERWLTLGWIKPVAAETQTAQVDR